MLVNSLFVFSLGAALVQATPVAMSNNVEVASKSTDVNEVINAMFGGKMPAELPNLMANKMTTSDAAMSAQSQINVVASINDLTQQAGMIKQKYTQANMADFDKLLSDIQGLIKNVATVLTGVNIDKLGVGQLVTSEQNKVCQALGSFITVVKDLIDGFIGEDGIFSKSLLLSPIVFFLRAVENGVESFARGLVDVVPTCKKDLGSQLDSLLGYLNSRVQTVCKGVAC
jgi:hypothetical protein